MRDMAASVSDTTFPAEVVAVAIRLGADVKSERVHLAQRGTMTEGPEKSWMRFSATDAIELATTAFDWRARTGPLSCLTVIDRLSREDARLEVRLLGMLPMRLRSGRARSCDMWPNFLGRPMERRQRARRMA
jgi:hypothetical protein